MTSLEKIEAVRSSISTFCDVYQRKKGSVKLIAVSKTRSSDEVLNLFQSGQRAFGENYLQEALEKINALHDYPLEWHFIGAIQSRKAGQVAQNFSWVHSLDRLKVANKLNQYASSEEPLNVMIQVNLEDETSKGGVAPKDLFELASQVDEMKNLHFRGLMFMPMAHTRFEEQRAVFRQARELFLKLKKDFPNIDQISMGMSGDLEAAIAEGATMVRVGTALFGPRAPKEKRAN